MQLHNWNEQSFPHLEGKTAYGGAVGAQLLESIYNIYNNPKLTLLLTD